jgi:hypothetical protein
LNQVEGKKIYKFYHNCTKVSSVFRGTVREKVLSVNVHILQCLNWSSHIRKNDASNPNNPNEYNNLFFKVISGTLIICYLISRFIKIGIQGRALINPSNMLPEDPNLASLDLTENFTRTHTNCHGAEQPTCVRPPIN